MTGLLEDLARALRDRRPQSVLLLRPPGAAIELEQLVNRQDPPPELTLADPAAWLKRPRPGHRRHQLGLLWDVPPSLPDADYSHLLAKLRDLDCQAVYVRCRPKPGDRQRQTQLLRSLGFLPVRDYTDGTLLSYFDIHDYKLLPGWLNSRFWANPEMWNKARW